MPDSERRRFPRYDADGLRGSLVRSLDARVLNVSLGGVAVETATQLSVDHRLAITLRDGGRDLVLPSTVRWCELAATSKEGTDEVRPVYRAGLEFRNVLGGRAEEVLDFLEQSLVVDVDSRLFARVDVDLDDPVRLESDETLEVRTLSLSGMLVETAVACEPDSRIRVELALDGQTFEADARVVGVEETSVEDHRLKYSMGVEFLEVPPEERRKLEGYVRGVLARDLGREI